MDQFGCMMAELVVASLDAVALAVCLRQLVKWRHTLNSLNDAPTLELSTNLKKQLSEEPDNTLKYVVLRGIVKPLGNAIKSNTDEKITGVVQKLTIKEHVVARSSTGFWSDDARTVYEMYNIMPFVITGNKMEVEIIDALEAKILDMDLITDRFEPLIPSLLDHVWGYFTGFRQRGMQTTEEMLRDGTLITAIGELTGTDGGSLKLQPPKDGAPLFLVTSTKASLIKKIKESQDLLRILAIVFGSIAIALSSHMIYKYMKSKRKKIEEEALKKRLADSRRQRKTKDTNLREEQLCIVCSDNPKEIILLPCGHVSLCENCSDNITDKCPVCRVKIESKALAFIT